MVGVFYNNYSGADNVYAALQGEKPWTDAEFAEANQLIKDWVDKGWFSGSLDNYFGLTHDDIWQALCDKKALMNIEGTWAFQDAPNFCNEDWEWAAIPALKNGVTPSYVLAIGSTVSLYAQSPNPEAAAQVLDWIVNDKARAAKIIEGFNFGEWNVPLHFTADDFSSGADPRYIRFVEQFAKDTGEGKFGYTTWTFWPAKTDQYIIEELDSVLTGDISVEDYQAEQQRLFTEEKQAGQVPPAPPTQVETMQ
jgi:raffinose/stachyose/melibiose transport system substrate-binding protein